MQTSIKQTQNIQSRIIEELDASPNYTGRRFWTEFEKDALRKYYGKKQPEAIAKALNRTRKSVMIEAGYLGLTLNK